MLSACDACIYDLDIHLDLMILDTSGDRKISSLELSTGCPTALQLVVFQDSTPLANLVGKGLSSLCRQVVPLQQRLVV